MVDKDAHHALANDHIDALTNDRGSHIDEFFKGYLSALVWSENTGDMHEGEHAKYNITDEHDHSDMTLDAISESFEDCNDFVSHNIAMLEERAVATDWSSMGHDFALTRNGHGAGFWDRGLRFDHELSEECKPYGSAHLMMDEDGLLFITG